MKLEFMRLENWRSFHGVNELWFAKDNERNVTLIRAENGVGKTSLLAALNWCLFNILPSQNEFENPKKLVNDQSGSSTTAVTVEFDHNGSLYRAVRSYDQTRQRTNELRLVAIKDGLETPLGRNVQPDRFIQSVIPREMAPHFFFYGEASSRYVGETGARAFGAAVKSILGSTVANMALSDLEKAHTDYRRSAADTTSDEASKLSERIDEIDEQITNLNQAIDQQKEEEEAAQELITKYTAELAGTESIKKDQQRRTELMRKINQNEGRLASQEAASNKWLNEYGVPLLSEKFINDVSTLLSQEDTRKKIPGDHNKKFITEILEDEECICGTEFKQDSIEYNKIKALLETATDQVMMDRVIQTQQALGKLLGRSKKAWSVRDTDLTNIAATTEIIRDDRTEETEISERLKNNNIKSIAEKEIAFQKARDAHKEAIRKQTTNENYIGTIEKEKATKISAQSELMRKSQIASRHLKRKDLALMLTNRLKNRLVDEELFARVEIKKKIDAIIERFMRKPFNVRIDENYRLKVINEKGDEIPKSTGENQMLGLAFTGAIASFAKERRYEESDILLSGTEAPLVVDSPFGHLDPLYRKGVANFLPNLASQVILLVSTSQASKEVLDELDGKIGTQYVLSRYNQFPQGNKESENLTINGKTIDLTKYDQQFTGTKIEEVTQ